MAKLQSKDACFCLIGFLSLVGSQLTPFGLPPAKVIPPPQPQPPVSMSAKPVTTDTCSLNLQIPRNLIQSTCSQDYLIDQKFQEVRNYCQNSCKSDTTNQASVGSGRNEMTMSYIQEILSNLTEYKRRLDSLEQLSAGTYLDCELLQKTGVYNITLSKQVTIPVFCDKTWTVIQRRFDGSTEFYRGWNDYKNGFGDLTREFWLGNDNIHLLTTQRPYRLRIELKDREGRWYYADYNKFWIDNAIQNFKLFVSGYSGNATNSLGHADARFTHNGMPFTTFDKDNDQAQTANCAAFYHGAWWFNNCFAVHLNGRYCRRDSPLSDDKSCAVWWAHERLIIAETVMKVKMSRQDMEEESSDTTETKQDSQVPNMSKEGENEDGGNSEED